MANPMKHRNPQRSKQTILLAAEELFARKGPSASVDLIARKSRLNKRMVYHYFGSKAGLWQAVLVRQYEKAARVETDLPDKTTISEITSELVARYYRFLASDKHFVKILMHENLQEGKFVRKLPVAKTKFPLLQTLEKALNHPDNRHAPAQLLIDCLALCFFYFSNQATLSTLFGFDLLDPKRIDGRIDHVRKIVRLIADPLTAAESTSPGPANS